MMMDNCDLLHFANNNQVAVTGSRYLFLRLPLKKVWLPAPESCFILKKNWALAPNSSKKARLLGAV